MSLSRVIGLVPTRLACPWLIRLCQVSCMSNTRVQGRSSTPNATLTIGTLSSLLPRLPVAIWISSADPSSQSTHECLQHSGLIEQSLDLDGWGGSG